MARQLPIPQTDENIENIDAFIEGGKTTKISEDKITRQKTGPKSTKDPNERYVTVGPKIKVSTRDRLKKYIAQQTLLDNPITQDEIFDIALNNYLDKQDKITS